MPLTAKRKAHPPAHALLLALVRGEPPENAAIDGEIWSEALGLAERHGVAPLLHETLRGSPFWLALSREQQSDLKAARVAELAREEKRARSLERILRVLAGGRGGREIPVLLIKGAASARTLYPAPELRPRGDLDLLARPIDRVEILGRLQRAGYAQHAKTRGTREDLAGWHERTLADPEDPQQQIDLHFALAQKERHWLDAETLFAASVRGPGEHSSRGHAGSHTNAARVLPAEEAALVCAHAIAIHELAVPLVTLCDLARLLERVEIEKLSQLARASRLMRALHVSIELLSQIGPAANRSSSLFAKAAPCAPYALCGARVDPKQLGAILALLSLSLPARKLLHAAAKSFDLSRSKLARPRQLWRKALFIDRPLDAARFAAAHAMQAMGTRVV